MGNIIKGVAILVWLFAFAVLLVSCVLDLTWAPTHAERAPNVIHVTPCPSATPCQQK
jgi:hypothetical protein